MAKIVHLPNGEKASFPDEMDNSQIESVLQKQFPSKPESKQKSFMDFDKKQVEQDFSKLSGQVLRESPYFAQGAINEPGKMANVLLPKNMQIPKVDIANKLSPSVSPEQAKGAEEFGGMFGMGLPRAGILGGLKAAQGIPKIGDILKKAMEASPILNKLIDVGGRGAEFGLYEAAEHPEQAGTRGALGFGLGAGLSGLGHGINSISESPLGKFIGEKINKKPIKEELLKGINPGDERMWERIKSSQELKSPMTLGEITGSPIIGSREGRLARTEVGGQKMYDEQIKRFELQEKAINKLLNTVSKENKIAAPEIREAANDYIKRMEKYREDIVSPIYEESYKKKVAPNKITNLERKDPVIKNAINHVLEDPTYSRDLEGYKKNSIKVLDLAQRRISDQIRSAGQGTNEARLLNKSRNLLLESMDKYSKHHNVARNVYRELSKPIDELKESQLGRIANVSDTQLKNVSKMIFDPQQADVRVLEDIRDRIRAVNPNAWDNIVRNEMHRLIGKGEGGKNFYKNLLQNKNVFNQLKLSLEHNPSALNQLDQMKKGWDKLIGIENPASAYGKSSKNIDSFRNDTSFFINMFKNFLGDKRSLEKINYISKGDYVKDLQDLMMAAPKSEERKNKLSDILYKSLYGYSALEKTGENN